MLNFIRWYIIDIRLFSLITKGRLLRVRKLLDIVVKDLSCLRYRISGVSKKRILPIDSVTNPIHRSWPKIDVLGNGCMAFSIFLLKAMQAPQ